MANHLDLEEQEQIEQLKHFWNSWGTLITSVLVVVFLGLAGWNGWQYWQKRQATQASALEFAVDEALTAKDAARADQAFSELQGQVRGHGAGRPDGFADGQGLGGCRQAR
jgi:predicted negative regulator of RcsB-dependent stress response